MATTADILKHSSIPGMKLTDFFAHYGVPGMRWGKRKDRGGSGVRTRTRKPSPTEHLSDEQLKAIIGRKLLEKQYRDLTAPKPSAGRKFIEGVLTDSGKKVASKYVTEYAIKGIGLAIAKGAAKTAVKAI